MVFPLYDDNSDRTLTPVVNYVLIAINILVFVGFQQFGMNEEGTYAFSVVPKKIAEGHDFSLQPETIDDPATGQEVSLPAIPPTPIPVYLTLITSMFLHANWLHIGGNMWFLWIFGDNIENYLGHVRYLAFYIVCGIAAALAHVMATYATNGNPNIPCMGASGAISAVMGAYLLLYPTRAVVAIVLRFITTVPAYVAVGIWFVLQLVSGVGLLGGGPGAGGGVAYGAHIGGFLSGAMLIKIFALGLPRDGWQEQPPERWDEGRYQ